MKKMINHFLALWRMYQVMVQRCSWTDRTEYTFRRIAPRRSRRSVWRTHGCPSTPTPRLPPRIPSRCSAVHGQLALNTRSGAYAPRGVAVRRTTSSAFCLPLHRLSHPVSRHGAALYMGRSRRIHVPARQSARSRRPLWRTHGCHSTPIPPLFPHILSRYSAVHGQIALNTRSGA
jgi:hypothetical protein